MRSNSGTVRAMFILGLLFFLFGFVTWLNGTLIPYLKLACELTTFEATLVATAFYIAYFVMALPAAKLLERTGYKNGMTWGLMVMALGALVFIPAALTRTYPLFLGGLFIIDDPIFGGLAVSLIFGLFVSTLLTLVVIPVLYYAVFRRRMAARAAAASTV